MRKTLFILAGICMMLCVLQGCQEKPLTVSYRNSYTDYDYYNRTQPYHRYDSIVFSDGSTGVLKVPHSPSNTEAVITAGDGRIIAVCSYASETYPEYLFPRYDRKGRMTELITLFHDDYESSELTEQLYDFENELPDLVKMRLKAEQITIQDLRNETYQLYRFDYNATGTVTAVTGENIYEMYADEGHYLQVKLHPTGKLYESDLYYNSHELWVEQVPFNPETHDCQYCLYINGRSRFDMKVEGGHVQQVNVYSPLSSDDSRLIENVNVTHSGDDIVFTHEYAYGWTSLNVYYHKGRKVKVEKLGVNKEFVELYEYSYLPDSTVNLSHLLRNEDTGKIEKQPDRLLKVWDDLYMNGLEDEIGYAKKLYSEYW